MKRYFALVLLLLLVLGCSGNGANELLVSGQVKGLKKGTIYLQQVKDSTLITLDSMVVGNQGSFELTASASEPDIFYLYLNKADNNTINDRIEFFTGPGAINIQTRWNNFETEAEITGSELQEKYSEFRQNQSRFHVTQLEVAHKMAALSLPEQQTEMDSLETVLNRLALRSYLYALNFALNNKNSYLSPYIAYTEVSDANPKYLDSIYNALDPEVAESKYGKKLKALLENR
ncbi:MAG: hypothetical protein RLZZ241_372 [Bacteroidota bacterium]